MRVFVAGATGVLGRQVVPILAANGHQVIGMGRRRTTMETSPDVELVTADALEPAAVNAAVSARPRRGDQPAHRDPGAAQYPADGAAVATHQPTTHRGARNLLEAATANGVRRVLAEGLAYAYDPADSTPADEDVPLWQHPPQQFAPVIDALVELEHRTREAGGLVLRMGHLYGPGTIYAFDGFFTEQVRARAVPLVGGGRSVFSFTHVEDAATAMLAALDRPRRVLNIVDDAPTPIADWLPALAALVGTQAAAPARGDRPTRRWRMGACISDQVAWCGQRPSTRNPQLAAAVFVVAAGIPTRVRPTLPGRIRQRNGPGQRRLITFGHLSHRGAPCQREQICLPHGLAQMPPSAASSTSVMWFAI